MNLEDLYHSGRLTADQLANLESQAQHLAKVAATSFEEASHRMAMLVDHGPANWFVDDEKEPTDEEVAVHLSEMDALEDTLTRLEEP